MAAPRAHAGLEAGFRLAHALRLPRALAHWTRGDAIVLMFHRVRAGPAPGAFAPNRALEVTPETLAAAIAAVREAGFRVAPLSELAANGPERLAALTFDDASRDTLDVAVPVCRELGAPLTVFACPGFADRTAPAWWLDLEAAVARQENVELNVSGARSRWPARSIDEKEAAFAAAKAILLRASEAEARAAMARLREHAGLDFADTVDAAFLDWAGLRELAADPLVDIGAHTLTHPRLATLPEAEARAEMAGSRARLEAELGRPVRWFAYPAGDAASAGPREFHLSAELGFAGAVTTRSGVVRFGSLDRHAIPRVSIDGRHQSSAALAVHASGLASAALSLRERLAGVRASAAR